MKIILRDMDQQGLPDIEVEDFPCILGRKTPPLGDLIGPSPRLRAKYKTLSRQHAKLFLQDGVPCLVDLGSSNGTWVNRRQVREKPVILRGGDTIRLSEVAYFKVLIERRPAAAIQPATEGRPAGNTVYMDSPSFLGIFNLGRSAARSRAGASYPNAASPAAGPLTGRLASLPVWVRYGSASLLALLLAGGLWLWATPRSQEQARELIQTGQTRQALALAGRQAAQNPAEQQWRDLAAQALLEGLARHWHREFMQQRHEQCQRWLAEMETACPGCPEVKSIIAAFRWISEAGALVAGRGQDSPVVLFSDENPIASLLAAWEANEKSFAPVLDKATTQQPSLAPLRNLVYGQVNFLKSANNQHLPHMLALARSLDEMLTADRPQDVLRLLSDFERRHPKVEGVERVRQDAANYLALSQALARQDYWEGLRLAQTTSFHSPPFQARVSELRQKVLPPPEAAQAHKQALESWRRGDHAQALRLLESLGQEPWGRPAREKADHWRRLLDHLREAKSAREAARHQAAVLELAQAIIPAEDGFILEQIRQDLEVVRDRQLALARRHLGQAQAIFQEYKRLGGITGVMRLEDKLSPAFRQRAAQLKAAWEEACQAVAIHRLLRQDFSPDQDRLIQDVEAEIKGQRGRICDLSAALDTQVLTAKLEMLPQPPAEEDKP